MKKIKILHIAYTLNLGGAETNLFNLVTAFGKGATEQHHVAYSSGGEIEARFLAGGVPVFKFAGSSHKVKSPFTLLIVARLWAYIMRNKIDIVHTHAFSGHVWGGLAAKLAGRKVVEHVHDGRYHDPADYSRRQGGFTQAHYVKYFCWLSDAVVVLTRQNVEYIRNNRLHRTNKVWHIMNGIPPMKKPDSAETKQRIRKNLRLPPDAFIITTLSRMAPEKNIELIIRIAPLVKNRIPLALFIVAGNGPQLNRYRSIVAKETGNCVRFTGYCEKTAELLAASDVFILPSLLELHSIALLEAMNMGLPVIISRDVGSNGDIITNGHDGFLLDPYDDEAWQRTIIDLWENPSLRAKMGETAKELCGREFDIASTAARFEKLYEHILKR
ncbi:MAG TPA: glycosyltransferase family 4 protein [Geobacteraceae bacterium]|nr:glycosyltransferase family 4 protein [Geobacteraceae bacterium]